MENLHAMAVERGIKRDEASWKDCCPPMGNRANIIAALRAHDEKDRPPTPRGPLVNPLAEKLPLVGAPVALPAGAPNNSHRGAFVINKPLPIALAAVDKENDVQRSMRHALLHAPPVVSSVADPITRPSSAEKPKASSPTEGLGAAMQRSVSSRTKPARARPLRAGDSPLRIALSGLTGYTSARQQGPSSKRIAPAPRKGATSKRSSPKDKENDVQRSMRNALLHAPPVGIHTTVPPMKKPIGALPNSSGQAASRVSPVDTENGAVQSTRKPLGAKRGLGALVSAGGKVNGGVDLWVHKPSVAAEAAAKAAAKAADSKAPSQPPSNGALGALLALDAEDSRPPSPKTLVEKPRAQPAKVEVHHDHARKLSEQLETKLAELRQVVEVVEAPPQGHAAVAAAAAKASAPSAYASAVGGVKEEAPSVEKAAAPATVSPGPALGSPPVAVAQLAPASTPPADELVAASTPIRFDLVAQSERKIFHSSPADDAPSTSTPIAPRRLETDPTPAGAATGEGGLGASLAFLDVFMDVAADRDDAAPPSSSTVAGWSNPSAATPPGESVSAPPLAEASSPAASAVFIPAPKLARTPPEPSGGLHPQVSPPLPFNRPKANMVMRKMTIPTGTRKALPSAAAIQGAAVGVSVGAREVTSRAVRHGKRLIHRSKPFWKTKGERVSKAATASAAPAQAPSMATALRMPLLSARGSNASGVDVPLGGATDRDFRV